MGNAIGSILPQVIGVAMSPIPIMAVILMLFSKRARTNGPAFLTGWVLDLTIVGSVVLVLAGGTPSTLSYAIHLLLLFLAVRNWQQRPKEGETPEMPQWMATVDSFTAGRAFGLSALLAGANPKNLALAAALSIAQAGLSGAQPWIALAVFVLLASISVATPVL